LPTAPLIFPVMDTEAIERPHAPQAVNHVRKLLAGASSAEAGCPWVRASIAAPASRRASAAERLDQRGRARAGARARALLQHQSVGGLLMSSECRRNARTRNARGLGVASRRFFSQYSIA